jgi:hypothetical protein
MHYLRAFALLLLLTRVLPAGQPAPILPNPKHTPGDAFDVSAEDVMRSRLREEGAGRAGMA